MKLVISPHPDAPLFDNPETGRSLLVAVLSELSSPHPKLAGEVIAMVKQAALVNYYFFLTSILAPFGPYEFITQEPHLDWCNFAQSDDVIGYGARAAIRAPRDHFKSSIFTHGLATWLLIRNPNHRFFIVNAIYDKAQDFVRIVKLNLMRNDLLGLLFPDSRIYPNSEGCNESQIVMPNRTRNYVEPSIKPSGITGAAEGGHYDGIFLDDPQGMDDLTSEKKSSVTMEAKKSWFKTNTRTLTAGPSTFIIYVDTPYSLDDVGSLIIDNAKEFKGYKNDNYKIKEKGEWIVYHREAIENSKPIFPSRWPLSRLLALQNDDWWTWITQFACRPQETGLAELYKYDLNRATLRYSKEAQDWIIIKDIPDSPRKKVKLSSCDIVEAVDPAGTDIGITSRTSRSAVMVAAMDAFSDITYFDGTVEYLDAPTLNDAIFQPHDDYPGYIRQTSIEKNAMQKYLIGMIEEEQRRRHMDIRLYPVDAGGDKTVRIRNGFGVPLSEGRIFATEKVYPYLLEEKNVFPQSNSKKDALDAAEKCIRALVRPLTEDEEDVFDAQDDEYENATAFSMTGY